MNFDRLLKRICPTLKRITYRLGSRYVFFNHDDLFQEAALHLWAKFQKGQLNDKTDSYILQGCYFHLKNYIRVAKDKAKLLSMDSLTDQGKEEKNVQLVLYSGFNKDDFINQLDYRSIVAKIGNNGLSPREKEVFFLCAQNLTTREIGNKLGISHVRVIKIKQHIRERYVKLLEN